MQEGSILERAAKNTTGVTDDFPSKPPMKVLLVRTLLQGKRGVKVMSLPENKNLILQKNLFYGQVYVFFCKIRLLHAFFFQMVSRNDVLILML